MAVKRCKDCVRDGVKTSRKIIARSGGRCATHHRANKRLASERTHATHIAKTYGLTPDEYLMIYEFQGGRCAICQRATGARRRLSVDHDHATGAVRMLACSSCNKMLGHLRDDPESFERAAECLRNPPADQALGTRRYVPIGGAPVKPGVYRNQ